MTLSSMDLDSVASLSQSLGFFVRGILRTFKMAPVGEYRPLAQTAGRCEDTAGGYLQRIGAISTPGRPPLPSDSTPSLSCPGALPAKVPLSSGGVTSLWCTYSLDSVPLIAPTGWYCCMVYRSILTASDPLFAAGFSR